MRKFLFVLPNSRWFEAGAWELYPYNVCLLAAVLGDDYDVSILDCNADNLDLNDALKRITSEQPDFVGISCLAVDYARGAHAIASGVKKCLPEAVTILGGVYCTLMPEIAMDDKYIDYGVLGEGELILKPLLKFIEKSKLPEQLDGVAYRNGDEIVIKPQKDFITDLDALPLPAYEKVDFRKYCYTEVKFSVVDSPDAVPVAKMHTSRGCPVGCNFCAVEHIAAKKFRPRSVENVLDEMQFLIDTYGIREIVFYDDNLLFDRKRAERLFQGMIDRKFNLKFKPVNVAVYRLDEKMLDLMRDAGCTTLVFAIESANDRVLRDIMGKPLSVARIRGVVEYAKSLGFRCAGLYVIGNPGETWDEIRNTIQFAESLDMYCHLSIATPLPKTRLYRQVKEMNMLTSDFSFTANAGCSRGWIITDQFAPFDLEVLRTYEWDRINFSTPERRSRTASFFKVPEEDVIEFARRSRTEIQKRYVADAGKRL